jgi:hypothetical protein
MQENAQEKKRPRRADILFIAGLLLVSVALVLILTLTRREGAFAEVEIDGESVARYALATDGEYTLNGGTNVLVIEDGEAYLTYADCPDLVCVKTGRIRYVGESIVCLPNRLSVVIRGEDADGGGVDLVS